MGGPNRRNSLNGSFINRFKLSLQQSCLLCPSTHSRFSVEHLTSPHAFTSRRMSGAQPRALQAESHTWPT